MNGDVRGVMHWMHNERVSPSDARAPRLAPDVIITETKRMARGCQSTMNLEPHSTCAGVTERRQMMMRGVALVSGQLVIGRPPEIEHQCLSCICPVRLHENVDVPHWTSGKRAIHSAG